MFDDEYKNDVPLKNCDSVIPKNIKLYFSLEILLIDRQMKGPCWLDLKNPREFFFFS